MTASPVDEVVNDYLNRLEVAAAGLPPARRTELLEEIQEHIDAARAAGAAADEATVRTMLDRLGEPEEIVAAALETSPAPERGLVATPPSAGLELAATLLLTVGSFVPLIGWAVGAVLLWGSRRWSTREKLLGTLVVPGGPAMALWLGLISLPVTAQSCIEVQQPDGAVVSECTGSTLSPWIGVPLFLALLIAPFIVAGLLYSRAKERAEAEGPVLRPTRQTATSAWTGQEIAVVLLFAAGGTVALIMFAFGILVAAAAAGVGLTLLWTSTRWDRSQQRAATIVVAAAPVLAFLLGTVWVLVVEGADRAGAGIALLPIGLALGMIAASIYLAVVLNRRRL
jgi:uncharacterized membrane protein